VLTADMRAVINSARLCFAATVTADGRPNLSPKGTIREWDDTHLFFLDIASPITRENLSRSPWMELNVVEHLSRRGYRFSGQAAVHLAGTAVYDEAMRRVFGEEKSPWPVHAVIMLAIEDAAPLLSPAYWTSGDETAVREMWKERRATLDRDFESHIADVGPVRVQNNTDA
jgi:uncharacterized protein